MRKIEIIVDSDGNVKVEAFGFRGRSCAAATADFLKALGGDQDERKKAEWYQREEVDVQQEVRNGR